MSYTTTADVKAYLGVTTTTDDTLIAGLIVQATAGIDAHCHRTFAASSDSTRVFDARDDVDGDTLILDRDLAAITSITNGDGTTVTATQYVVEPRNAIADGVPISAIAIRSDADITWTYDDYHEGAISIVGRWAYSTTAPYDIQQACVRLAAWMYRQRENRTGDDDRTIIAGNATLLPSTVPSDIRTLLAPYRRRR